MSCSSTIANMESENGPWWLDVSAKELDGLFYKAARFCNNFVYGDYS